MSADYIIKNDLQLRINEYSHKLNGKVVVITGAASGIGRMATLDYVKYGANVVASDIDEDGLKALSEEVNSSNLLTKKVNVVDYEEQLELFRLAESQFGRIDIVCANAGINPSTEFMNPQIPSNIKPTMKVVDINYYGVLYTCHLAVKAFRRNKVSSINEKCIIITGSFASFHSLPKFGLPYAATKAAVLSLVNSLSEQGQIEGFRCNCVNPWFAATNIIDKRLKILLTGLPLAPVPAISEAFILASTTDATNQAWAVDEHGLWVIKDFKDKFNIVEAFMSRYLAGSKIKTAFRNKSIQRNVGIASAFALLTGLTISHFFY